MTSFTNVILFCFLEYFSVFNICFYKIAYIILSITEWGLFLVFIFWTFMYCFLWRKILHLRNVYRLRMKLWYAEDCNLERNSIWGQKMREGPSSETEVKPARELRCMETRALQTTGGKSVCKKCTTLHTFCNTTIFWPGYFCLVPWIWTKNSKWLNMKFSCKYSLGSKFVRHFHLLSGFVF